MIKRRFFIRSLFVCLAVFSSACDRQGGWGKYVKVLQKCTYGLTPYWIPNPKDGPGTILEVLNGVEQLVYSASNAFQNLSPEPVDVPSFVVSEVSSIEFRVGAKASDEKILPVGIAVAAKFAYKKDTKVSLVIEQPRLFRIESGLITEALKSFDLRNSRQEEIIKKLMQPNTILISGALRLNGFKFTFDNVSKLEAEQEAKLSKYIADENMRYDKLSDTQFCLTADTLMYIAYYAYPIDTKQMKLLYDDLQRIRETGETNEKMAQIETQMPDVVHGSLGQLTEKRSAVSVDLEKLRSQEKELTAETAKTTDESARKQLMGQLSNVRNRIRAEETGINRLNAEVSAVEKYSYLQKISVENADFPKKFKAKKYELFGKEKIISERIKGLI
jgi:hypothetical protein